MTSEANMRELQQTLTAAFGAALREALPDAMAKALQRAPTAPTGPTSPYMTVKGCAEEYGLSKGWLEDQLRKRNWQTRPDLAGLHDAVYKPHDKRLLLRRDLFDTWFQGFKEIPRK